MLYEYDVLCFRVPENMLADDLAKGFEFDLIDPIRINQSTRM